MNNNKHNNTNKNKTELKTLLGTDGKLEPFFRSAVIYFAQKQLNKMYRFDIHIFENKPLKVPVPLYIDKQNYL